MDFRTALARVYQADPCRVLPNPLWKTLDAIPNCQASLSLAEDGTPDHLEAWQGARLLLYWDQHRSSQALAARLEQAIFVLLHQDDLAAVPPGRFPRRKAYYRLRFRGNVPDAPLPPGFLFRPFSIGSVAGEDHLRHAASLIERCFPDLHPGVEEIRSWTKKPVFTPALWVWVWDETANIPAGLGIAELDRKNKEAALEWIQVLPEYRRKSLGRALVCELLSRLQDSARLVTVSGEVQNPTAPERLYRQCGFAGSDTWWVLAA